MTSRHDPVTDASTMAKDSQLAQHITITVDLAPIAQHLATAVAEHVVAALPTSSSPWLDVESAAAYLTCSPERIRKLITRRQIPFHQERSGGRVFLHRRELDEWLLGL